MCPRMSCFGSRCLGPGCYEMRCQWFAIFPGPSLRCRPAGSGGWPPGSLLQSSLVPLLTTVTTLLRQPYQELHRELLVERRLPIKGPPYCPQNPLPAGVLEHIPCSPSLHSIEEVVRILVHGYHHYASLWHLLLDLPRGLEAVHDWHPHVHEDQVWPQLPAQGECLLTIVGFCYDFDTLFAGEHGSQAFPDQGVIVSYEDACRRGFVRVSHFSLLPKTHQRLIRTFEGDQTPEPNRLKVRAF